MITKDDITLTKAEEEIMQVLWKLEKGFVKDILEQFPEPKPAYNTVSTIVRILETKGYVDHKAFGKTHEYYPLIRREEYTKVYFDNFLRNHFNNSFQKMVSFFTKSDGMNVKELEETLRIMQTELDKQKNSNQWT